MAEALILRADSQKRFEQLKQRLQQNARVQEGDTPAEDPADLLAEIEHVAVELTRMIQQINRTNSTVMLTPQQSLADALAARDVLKLRIAVYRDLAQAAAVNSIRTTRSEIKFRSTISVAEVQKQADQLAKAYRELDAQIQAANWLTELQA
jgi:hypothetical protein